MVAKSGDATKQGDGTDVLGKDSSLRIISHQDLAKNVRVGMRMPSHKVLSQADARPWHLQELLKSNGRWRLVIFAGNISDKAQKETITKLGEKLSREDSFLNRFTPRGSRYDSVIEVLTVHSAPRQGTTIFDFPEVFRPWHERDGWDYWKIFVDDISYHEGHSQAYENYGIDPERGCAVILRPDQYVSWVGEVDDYESMDKFFRGFMVARRGVGEKEEGLGKKMFGSPDADGTRDADVVVGANGGKAHGNGKMEGPGEGDVKHGSAAVSSGTEGKVSDGASVGMI